MVCITPDIPAGVEVVIFLYNSFYSFVPTPEIPESTIENMPKRTDEEPLKKSSTDTDFLMKLLNKITRRILIIAACILVVLGFIQTFMPPLIV